VKQVLMFEIPDGKYQRKFPDADPTLLVLWVSVFAINQLNKGSIGYPMVNTAGTGVPPHGPAWHTPLPD
jgi:hypothetical protein